MELSEDVMSDFQSNSLRSMSSSNKSKMSCFPFSVSRITNRVTRHLFRRNKRRSTKSQLTTNMDSYQYTPSNNELHQLLYI